MMEIDKEKHAQKKKLNDGSIWRSATSQKKIKGYSDMVLTQHRITQPTLPPTTLILNSTSEQSTN